MPPAPPLPDSDPAGPPDPQASALGQAIAAPRLHDRQAALRRLSLTWLTYGFVGGILVLSAAIGLLPPWVALVQIAYHWSGQLCFYALLRSGWSLRRPDPMLTFEQLLFGVTAIVLGYALSPDGRGTALQLLCLALVFDMQRLSSRQLVTAAWGAVALLASTMALSWWMRPVDFNVRRELLNLVMAAIQLPVLSMIARDVRQMRQKQLQQRRDLQATLARLQDLSQRDTLTGLVNRRHMGRLLAQELKRFARHRRRFSVALIDLDHFKQVNDRFGHAIGDQVLRTIAGLAHKHLPPADTLARWGGEEFLLLLPEHNAHEATAVVEALRQRVADFDWSSLAEGLQVGFSAGITDHGSLQDTEHRLLERADLALYEAKAHGRNQVRCQPGGLSEDAA